VPLSWDASRRRVRRSFAPTGLSLPRLVLDAALVDAARGAGAEVAEGATLVELLYDGGAVAGGVVRLGDGSLRRVRAPLVIGADGRRSWWRAGLGTRRHGLPARIAFVPTSPMSGGSGRRRRCTSGARAMSG